MSPPSDPSLPRDEAPPAPSEGRPAPADLLIAGRYRPLRLLGSGGMGEVFLAVHEGPQGFRRVVALKRMRPSGQRDWVQHFLDEARLVAKLAHRNVIQIYELGEGEGGFFVAMEYVRGPCVERLIERLVTLRQSLPPALALDIAAQVADGLDYAYSARDEQGEPLRIVHRDVSPHNVLVSVAGDVKLIDFGVAKSAAQRHVTVDATLKGKIAYLSPEQARGEPLDGRSDLFGLGIVLYEMLAARHPFIRSEPLLTLSAIEHAEWARLAKTSPELAPADAVLEKLLARSPEDRFPSGAAASEALAALRSSFPAPPMRLGPFVSSLFGKELDELDQQHGASQATLPSHRPGGATEVFGAAQRGGTPPPAGATEVFGAAQRGAPPPAGATAVFGAPARPSAPGATEMFGRPATPAAAPAEERAPGAPSVVPAPAAAAAPAPARPPAASDTAVLAPELEALRRAKRRSATIALAALLAVAGVGIGAVVALSGGGAGVDPGSAAPAPPDPKVGEQPAEPPAAPKGPPALAVAPAADPKPAPKVEKEPPQTPPAKPAPDPARKADRSPPAKTPASAKSPAETRKADRPAPAAKETKVAKAAAKEPRPAAKDSKPAAAAKSPEAKATAAAPLYEVTTSYGDKSRTSVVRKLPGSVLLLDSPAVVRLVFAAAGQPPTLQCDPWQIVSIDGVSIGKSPVELGSVTGEPKVIELRRPNTPTVELRLTVRQPGK